MIEEKILKNSLSEENNITEFPETPNAVVLVGAVVVVDVQARGGTAPNNPTGIYTHVLP